MTLLSKFSEAFQAGISRFTKTTTPHNLRIALSALLLTAFAVTASAQISGSGAIAGTVTDSTGALIPGATVTATAATTGVKTVRVATSAGDYNIAPLNPGLYSVTVTAKGFEQLVQNNVNVDALATTTVTVKLTIGQSSETVTVDAAPPQLSTSDATLGGTMEQDLYSALPIEMGAYGQADQRRATDFAFLMPGVQGNNTTGNATTNTGIVNGSGSRGGVSVVYIDGTPFVRAGGNGDPRFVWTAISVDAVDQFQVQTSGYSAIYEGQGIQNYTVKAGGNKYHGSIYEFIRNTAFDTYGWLLVQNPVTGKYVKPIEHSNEYGINLSGPLVPLAGWKDKVFFFGNYNGFRYSSQTPALITFPTLAQQGGNFTGVSTGIYDPTTQMACTANNANAPCRYRYGYGPSATPGNGKNQGNPIPTGAPIDVIPASELSAVALKAQSFLPALTNQNLQNNYNAANATGLVNWSTTDRIDYVISPKDTLSMTGAIGRQASSNPTGQTTAGRNVGPLPYNYSQAFAPKTAVGIIEETHVFGNNLVNQFKYGYARYNGPTFQSNETPAYAASTLGISGAPSGAATNGFPIVTFAGTNAPTNWGGTTPNVTLAENFTLLDNLQWTKGKHSFTFGGQIAWMQYNTISATGGSTPLTLANAVTETEGLNNAFTTVANTGAAYASFLIGQIDKTSFTTYLVPEYGTRFRAISPYVQDNWKVTSKLTLDLGLRYDIFPSLREANDHQSFFNPNLLNPVTGVNGALEFAGHGTGTCNCDTPVSTWFKNFGPRLGLAYQIDSKTVVHASYGVMFTHGNAVGGSATTLGVLGFSAAPSFPSNGSLLSTAPFTGTGGAIPAYQGACGVNSGAQFGTGYYSVAGPNICGIAGTTSYTAAPSSVAYADPYLGSRAPEYVNWTLGFQHQWTNAITSSITYVGSQGHFLPADGTNARGLFSNSLNPSYLGLGLSLSDTGTTKTTSAQDCVTFSLPCPTNFVGSQALSAELKPFPFQGVTDGFGYVANSNYNALQATLNMRASHGLTFMANYTWSRSIDDGGSFRTGYAIPSTYSNNGKSWGPDAIERSVSTSNQPQHAVVTGVWDLPLGRSFLGTNAAERAILGGFKFSEIFQAFSGSPLAITASSCQTNPAQTCNEPNLNPLFSGPAHVNGKWGQGATSITSSPISYIALSAGTQAAPTGPFIAPAQLSATAGVYPNGSPFAPLYTFSNAPRTAAYNLYGPGNYQLDLALVRTFPLHFKESANLNFRAEMTNVTNKTFFAVANSQLGNAAFGTVTTNGAYNRRAAQFSGRINF
jgi:Carboxypeptidase regulatory-like domain/TonB dependent receptor